MLYSRKSLKINKNPLSKEVIPVEELSSNSRTSGRYLTFLYSRYDFILHRDGTSKGRLPNVYHKGAFNRIFQEKCSIKISLHLLVITVNFLNKITGGCF